MNQPPQRPTSARSADTGARRPAERRVRAPDGPATGAWTSLLFATAEAAAQARGAAEPSCFGDLNLDQVVDAVAYGADRERLAEVFYLPLADADAVQFRHEVWRDLERPAVLGALREFAERMTAVRARLAQAATRSYARQKQRWLLDAAREYCGAVTGLAEELRASGPRSVALRGLGRYLDAFTASAAFTALRAEADLAGAALAQVQYCLTVRGDSVRVSRYTGQPDYAAEVEAAFERFRGGEVKGYLAQFLDVATMNHVEASILGHVAALFPEPFAALSRFCERHRDFVDEVVDRAGHEAQFYLAYLRYLEPMRAAGLPFCYPSVARSKTVAVRDGFDLALAAQLVAEGRTVVLNDVELREGERIVVVSGPNQGGKTTFARMFGQLHHLTRLGVPVPGREASLPLCDQVFTHFEHVEHVGDLRGKLQDELLRIHDVLEHATGDSVLVLNESFASTTTVDAVFLASRVMARIVELGALCVCVTFLDELATFDRAAVSMTSSIVAGDPARRTYQIRRRPTAGLAYAAALAEKYRLTYAEVQRRLSR